MKNQPVLSRWENKMFSAIPVEQNAPWKTAMSGQTAHSSVLAATHELQAQMAYIIQVTVQLFQNQTLREERMMLILKRINVIFCCKC